MIRQGDVLIIPVKSIPKGAVKVAPVNGRYVIAEGEATGHAHAIMASSDIELYEKDGVLYCVAKKATELTHQEHATQPVTKVNQFVRQCVWSAGEARRVAD